MRRKHGYVVFMIVLIPSGTSKPRFLKAYFDNRALSTFAGEEHVVLDNHVVPQMAVDQDSCVLRALGASSSLCFPRGSFWFNPRKTFQAAS